MACPKKRPWDPLFTLKIFWMGDVGVDLNSVDLGTNSSDHQDNIFNIFFANRESRTQPAFFDCY